VRRNLYDTDHEAFREVVQAFIKREVEPNAERWEAERNVDRAAWLAAGKQSIIGHLIPERFGGLGTEDYRFRAVVTEELAKVGAASVSSGFGLQDDIAIPYIVDLGTEEQLQRWLPARARAGRGQRPAGHPDHGRQGRRRLDRQRRQDVYHQRHQRRPGHRGGTDQPRRRVARHQPAGG
jgi:alkylation response protein AidB-like acyl-CoA dehydrogenase